MVQFLHRKILFWVLFRKAHSTSLRENKYWVSSFNNFVNTPHSYVTDGDIALNKTHMQIAFRSAHPKYRIKSDRGSFCMWPAPLKDYSWNFARVNIFR